MYAASITKPYKCLKRSVVPRLILSPLQDQKMQYATGKLTIRPCFMQDHQDKEIHEVTIVPRTPSKQITEPIMLFCKISISLVI